MDARAAGWRKIVLIPLVSLLPTHYKGGEGKRLRSARGADIMALGGWKIADKLRRQEALVGGIAALLLAVATMAVTYLYY